MQASAIILPLILGLGAAGVTLASGCWTAKGAGASDRHTSEAAPEADVSPAVLAPPGDEREPRTLLRDSTSAYRARVFARGSEAVILTPTAFFSVDTNQNVASYRADLGHLSTLLDDAIVFWRDSALVSLSLAHLGERELVRLERQPQALLAQGQRLAWLTEDKQGGSALETWSAGSRRRLYTSQRPLLVPVLDKETVYFIERSPEGWRLGRVTLDGEGLGFGELRKTRPPPMLAVGPDGVYFYDGLARGVRRVGFDLRHEAAVNEDAICAPLAVSQRVFCAQVGGIAELPRSGAAPRLVSRELGGPITELAINDTTVFWIADSGKEALTVRSIALPSP